MRVIRQLARSRIGAVVIASFVTLVVGTSNPSVAAGSFAVSSSAATAGDTVMHHFTPIYMGGPARYTHAQAIAIALRFDVIAEKDGTFAPYVEAMHLANPALRIVVYLNAAFDTTSKGTAYPLSWYAHDSLGNRIQSVGSGNWLMDPTNPQWAPTVANLCAAAMARSRDDGCFIDTLGLAPVTPSYVTGLPVNPTTHQVYSPAAWISAQTHTVAAVAKVTNVVLANGLANGTTFSNTSLLLATSHLAMAETWLRLPSSPATMFPTTATWLAAVNMLTYGEAHGWRVMAVTKLWTSATAAQVSQWHKFTIASFLMGASGLSAYNFTAAKSDAGMTALNSYDNVAIGTPMDSYSLQGGVYQRIFTNGVAIVNPGTVPVNVVLGMSFKNLDGTTVTHETLPPDSGDVFVLNGPPSAMMWGFEDGSTENWAGGNAHLTTSTVGASSSASSLCLTVTANGGAYALGQHPFAGTSLRAGRSVSLSMYVKAGNHARYAQAILDWYTASGAFISQTLGTPARSSTSTWTQYSVTGTAPPSAAFYAAEYFVGNGSLSGEVSYIDLVKSAVR
jgi:hypothetical protein